jgi:3-dehydroquinate dehydratase-1
MRTVVSVQDAEDIREAEQSGADLIELRLDLMPKNTPPEALRTSLPRILTLRSDPEGGAFDGTAEEWIGIIRRYAAGGGFVDVETRFRQFSTELRSRGLSIISSCHTSHMPGGGDLAALERDLRSYGDLPKIIVTPGNGQDVLDLLAFTLAVTKPVCTGVMGRQYNYVRAFLPFFGSELVYCHIGTPVAEGQFHIRDFRTIQELLNGSPPDTDALNER